MKKWLHKLEVFVDKLIPFLLLVLILIVVGEFTFREFIVENMLYVEIIDGFIIFVFVLDLIFKYRRSKTLPDFIRASWLEVIAIFPFFLVFRLFESIFGLFTVSETVTRTQQIIHIGEGIEKEVSVTVKEGGRAERLARFLRPLARSVRFFKLGNPEVRKRAEDDIKNIEKGTETLVKDIGKTAKKDIKKVTKEVEKVPRYVKAAIFYEKPEKEQNEKRKLR